MNTSTKLITDIEQLTVKTRMRNPIKIFIKDNLDFIYDLTTKNEQEQINGITNILKKSTLNAADKKELVQTKKFMVGLVKKYEEKFNENPNEDIVEDDHNLTETEIEQLLDKKIPKYNKFSEQHPMTGITYDKTNNRYDVNISGNRTEKNLIILMMESNTQKK